MLVDYMFYDVVVVKRAPTPIRFDEHVAARLASWAVAHDGMSLSSAVNHLVDEALRIEEHPGITFRPGPTGRRAGLIGGPDVWEVVRAIKSARAAEPELRETEILQLVSDNSGVPVRLIKVAIHYWASYPDEIDTWIAAADEAEDRAEAALRRERDLLGGR